MKITIKNNQSKITFDGFNPAGVDAILKLLKGSIEITTRKDDVNQQMTDDEIHSIREEMDIDYQRKTPSNIDVANEASECLRMLKYWDEYKIHGECGGIIHQRCGDTNTMKVVKSFLDSLINKIKNND